MHNLNRAEFYITNVCNLNCKNCNRYNNFAFTGHQLWNDYKDVYARWAQTISLNEISILGGEPFLNPSFIDWVKGVRELWPNTPVGITTNGTQFQRWPELYEIMRASNQQIFIDISLHGNSYRDQILQDLTAWLQAPVVENIYKKDRDWNSLWQDCYNRIKDTSWPGCNTPEDFTQLPIKIQQECEHDHNLSLEMWQAQHGMTSIQDANGVRIELRTANFFADSAVIHDELTNQLTLHDSDPELAVDVCYSKYCHEFIDGKLYKCGTTALLPKFLQQFPVTVSPGDLELINSYVPAEITWSDRDLSAFIQQLDRGCAVPQCKFCPEKLVFRKFVAGTKKLRLLKK